MVDLDAATISRLLENAGMLNLCNLDAANGSRLVETTDVAFTAENILKNETQKHFTPYAQTRQMELYKRCFTCIVRIF